VAISSRPRNRSAEQLQERLVAFAAEVCTHAKQVPRDRATDHIIEQVVRAAASPAANYAEARAAQSRRDFIHKMGICLKELRETQVWLELERRASESMDVADLERECNELTAIFVSSINTARRGLAGHAS
jgi:four helix bundle protein